MYFVEGERIVNATGDVAVRYLTAIPHVVSVMGTEYAFVVQFTVNITWVKLEHLSAIFEIKKSCCGGSSHQKYVLANETSVRLWLGLGR